MRRPMQGLAYPLAAISLAGFMLLLLVFQSANIKIKNILSQQPDNITSIVFELEVGMKHSSQPVRPTTAKTKISTSLPLPCPTNPIVVGTDGGRLGNKIWEYAAVWSLAQLLGRPGYVPQSLLAALNKVFAKLSLSPLESINHCNVSLGEPFHRSQLLPIKKLKNKLKQQNLLLMPWILMPEPVLQYRRQLTGEFNYRSEIVEHVKETVREVGGEGKLLVGIHVRRTDFDKFLPKYFKTTLVGHEFFLDAMDWYRKNIAGQLMFIIVSDDVKWCKDNLMIFNDTVIASKSPEHDLVLLSTCDHRIIDYGTFGYWGALMGSGHTISLNVDKAFNTAMVSKNKKWHLYEPSKYSRSKSTQK